MARGKGHEHAAPLLLAGPRERPVRHTRPKEDEHVARLERNVVQMTCRGQGRRIGREAKALTREVLLDSGKA